ncbi:uncharacterized protein BP5553_01342 [Venustampulla echinocandica]|uniref:Protein BIG1 n=1 Tax=Venustampulla echinocandica TaxID=2656787 RepID=A0A370U0T7_9HELO|nr:uncharacterized protein BP5553_01342 [Venustampulla echinocandica]RDL41363.1 hypothetical protein BP5553_01342 [Venustampulla echinocandica]
MRLSIAAAAACLASAHAFKDTSPFLLFASSQLPSALQNQQSQQLQSASNVLNTAKKILGKCDQDIYYFVHQLDVNAAQLSSNAPPHLTKALSDSDARGRYSVSEVIDFDREHFDQLVDYVETQCKATAVGQNPSGIHSALESREDNSPLYAKWNFGALPKLASERKTELANNDAELNTYLKDLPKDYKYTVIYTTSPPSTSVHDDLVYEPAFDEAVHMDLKRQLLGREGEGASPRDTRPLFEKYQFFTPGLFMGILVSLLLLSILGVGISAISSLQVSYKAFDKENGPAAQKKQQ